MVPLGLGQAASVRVGHAFGAHDARAVARAGWTALAVTMAYVALSATTMLAFPRLLIAPFLSRDAANLDEIVALALSFLRIAAMFQLFDGAQAALANMLRGVHDSRWPMMMALVGYWAIGAPVGVGSPSSRRCAASACGSASPAASPRRRAAIVAALARPRTARISLKAVRARSEPRRRPMRRGH